VEILMRRTKVELITSGRQTGRTTQLIEWAAEETPDSPMRYIVVPSHRDASQVRQMAEDLGHQIAFPLTPTEVQSMTGLPRQCQLSLDNLSLMLNTMLHTRLEIVKVVW
jgi:uncharacterized iron-regulated membrane protein